MLIVTKPHLEMTHVDQGGQKKDHPQAHIRQFSKFFRIYSGVFSLTHISGDWTLSVRSDKVRAWTTTCPPPPLKIPR